MFLHYRDVIFIPTRIDRGTATRRDMSNTYSSGYEGNLLAAARHTTQISPRM